MKRPGTVGSHLARLVTLSTAIGLLVFTVVAAGVVWLDEQREVERGIEIGDPDERDDDPLQEVLQDLGLAIAIATPLGLLLALAGARWAARRVTARLDALIATASRMTTEQLGERLPVSDRGDELDALAESLNDLFARVDEGMASLRRFAADASHELRTPLAVTINSLEVATRRPRDVAEWERVAQSTLEELRAMADLVEVLLQGARTGGFEATDEIDVDAELAAMAVRWQAAAKAADVRVELDARSNATARIDPRALSIATGNLVNNAITHSPAGGLVTVRAEGQDGTFRIEVDDQGPGVAPDQRSKIFAPFTRTESSSGAGLGLSIARRIVEAHRGRIGVEDAARGGARFTIELPRI